jgi:hypothetical protein
MLRQSLIAVAFALATATSTLPAGAQTNTHSIQHRTIVHHIYQTVLKLGIHRCWQYQSANEMGY